MEDLLQSQIKKSCDLAHPNGLKELMWDISREVLSAQPSDMYDFITKYLSVLLVTRENLTVAAKVCDEACRSPCELVLEDKLRDIGLNDGDVDTAKTIIMEHLEGAVNEGHLLLTLMRKTNINEAMLPALQEAIRSAFIHHQTTRVFEPSSDCEDEVTQAASHTLRLYEATTPSHEEYSRMATKIQAAYRAYGVRRSLGMKKNEIKEKSSEIKDKTLKFKDANAHVEIKESEKQKSPRKIKVSVTTESSPSLAGSYLKLPKDIPYSAHNLHDYGYEEVLEKVHSISEFADDTKYGEEKSKFNDENVKEGKRAISFETIEDDVIDADYESEGSIEELIHVECEDSESEKRVFYDENTYKTLQYTKDSQVNENIDEIITFSENTNEHIDRSFSQ